MADRTDLDLLSLVLAEDITDAEREAFGDMREAIVLGADLVTRRRRALSEKQRAWATSVHERFAPTYENLVSSGRVPRGREVESMVGALPKRPPGRV